MSKLLKILLSIVIFFLGLMIGLVFMVSIFTIGIKTIFNKKIDTKYKLQDQ